MPLADANLDGGDLVWVLVIVLIIMAIIALARGRV